MHFLGLTGLGGRPGAWLGVQHRARFGVLGFASQLRHQLGAGDAVHVQGLGQPAHHGGGELVLAKWGPILNILNER